MTYQVKSGGDMVKRFLLMLIIVLFFTSCGPGQILGPTITPSPTVTITPTKIPRPTSTPIPKYTLETGLCLDFRDIEGDPKDIGCVPLYNEIVNIGNAGYITISSKDVEKPFLMYCVLYDSKGFLIDSEIQEPGSTYIICGLNR